MTVQVLGQKIRYLRRREGLSQEEFAARAGVSHRKLSDIECGNGNPTFDTMDCIAAAFGLQIEELLQKRAFPPAADGRPASRGVAGAVCPGDGGRSGHVA